MEDIVKLTVGLITACAVILFYYIVYMLGIVFGVFKEMGKMEFIFVYIIVILITILQLSLFFTWK